ncbi:MAG: hypothetical protein KAZ18_02105 [Acinetobacter sp.]|nr:hypothetical protein [Acinetobacter sp.]
MTIYALQQAIKTLVEVVRTDNFGDVQAIDASLAEVMAFNDPAAIRPLIRLIEDTAPYDEAIFSIIHCIESFDEDVYISEFLKELSYLVHKSPQWASVLFMRVLNSNSARECITEQIYFATPEIKAVVLWLVERINEKSPKFLSKTAAIIVAANSD